MQLPRGSAASQRFTRKVRPFHVTAALVNLLHIQLWHAHHALCVRAGGKGRASGAGPVACRLTPSRTGDASFGVLHACITIVTGEMDTSIKVPQDDGYGQACLKAGDEDAARVRTKWYLLLQIVLLIMRGMTDAAIRQYLCAAVPADAAAQCTSSLWPRWPPNPVLLPPAAASSPLSLLGVLIHC